MVSEIVRVVVTAVSINNVSFKTEDEKWYNYVGDAKTEMRDLLTGVDRGCTIDVGVPEGLIGKYDSIKLVSGPSKDYEPKQNNGSSKSFVEDSDKFDNVLKEFKTAYPNYSKSVEVLEHDFEKKFAMIRVTLNIGKKDKVRTISAIGDAFKENIKSSMIQPHYIRLAETRAFARCMRFILARGVVAEEKSDSDSRYPGADRVISKDD